MKDEVVYKTINGRTVKVAETLNGRPVEDNAGADQNRKSAKPKEEKGEVKNNG